MKIVIVVSQISPGGGLTKYVANLAYMLSENSENIVSIITTHHSEENVFINNLVEQKRVNIFQLGHKDKISKYISLVGLVHRLAPDIIVNNYNAPLQYILPFISRKCKIVHVLHSNTDDFYRVASINGRLVDAWVAPTPALKEYFDNFTTGKYRGRIHVIAHGVESPLSDRLRTSVIQLAYVGVLYEHKGVKILPDIIKGLRDRGLDFRFTFIGDGILRDYLCERLATEIEDGVVEFTGRIPAKEVYSRLSSTDVFVYPTHIDAFGLVIAEAMINGAVPVVTLLRGITDSLIVDGKSGFLVEQDNVSQFCDRIESLIKSYTLLESMRRQSESRAKSLFTLDIMKSNYVDFFNRLIADKDVVI